MTTSSTRRDTRDLVDESITIIREVASEFERPALLFSGGKDSVVMLELALMAFQPARLPFPVVHIDTGQNFPEVIEFRDRCIERAGARLIVGSVEDSIQRGTAVEQTGPGASRNPLQTVTLLETVEKHRFDALFGGARRDEERARAKERVYSLRDVFGQWDPKNQRPELWGLYNGQHRPGEHFRIFPLSNWTELDIWSFVAERGIELPSIYYAHEREVFNRNGLWMAVTEHLAPGANEVAETRTVRFRTVGDATCTAAVESDARGIEDVLAETAAARITERGATRIDDRISEAGMEDRKKAGYF
jgi:sulfate adenylyltransferase subunit 2